MRTVLAAAFAVVFLCPAALSQAPSPSKDAPTLQALIEEVHKLRQDLQVVAATTQRAQILLHRVRIQMDTVAQANTRLEEVRKQLNQAKFQRTQLTNQLKQQGELLERAQDQAARDEAQQEITRLKEWLEQSSSNESEAIAKEAECASQLRIEQEKLDELQSQLDRLDKNLEVAALQARAQ